MKIYVKYIISSYLKYVFIIFIALEFFYTTIDVFLNLSDFPKSANLQLLHLVFTMLIALNYTLPLSLIFAFILTFINMIKSNEFVSFFALGITKNRLITPIFLISLLISLIYIGLNFTNFAYSKEYRENLTQSSYNSDEKFIKYSGKYIYIGFLNHISGEAKNIKIFDVSDIKISKIIMAKFAEFNGQSWILSDVDIIYMPKIFILGGAGYKKEHLDSLEALEGFIPKTIENIYNGDFSYSAFDAYDAIKTFQNEGVNTNSIKATLYWLTISPLFAPLLIMILFYFLPATARFFNLVLIGFIFVVIALCAWGILFVLVRFAQNSVIMAEIATIIPIIILFLLASKLYFSHR